MFASLAWMEMAGALLGGVMQNAIFAATVGWMSNFVFLLDAAIYLLVALLSMYVADTVLASTCKKLSYRRGTARCVVLVEMLPVATQQCSTTSKEGIEVMELEG